MAKRRSKEEQIAALQLSHAREVLHSTARSGLDIIKTKMHARDYEGARLEAGRVFVELTRLCGVEVPGDALSIVVGGTEHVQREFCKVTDLKPNEGKANASR